MGSKVAVYPGTFDPITNGHLGILTRALKIFDNLVIAILNNPKKVPLFSMDERIAMIKEVLRDQRRVQIDSYNGLLVDYVVKKNSNVIIRGLRALSDFEYEFQMALMNRKLAPKIITVFLMPHDKYTYLNSSIIREVASFGGDVSQFVPPGVAQRLQAKFPGRR